MKVTVRRSRRDRRTDLSRGTWGWDNSKTIWVPPQYAGVRVRVDLFANYRPIPPALRMFESQAEELYVVSCRRGGKTHNLERVAAKRIYRDSLAVRRGEDTWTRRQWNEWFAAVVGPPGQPQPLRQERLKRIKAPAPYWVVAPDYGLADEQAVELTQTWCQPDIADALGVVWKQRSLWIFGLGVRIDLKTAENPRKLVGAGLLGIWAGECARFKPGVWRHFEPCLYDRNGWLLCDSTPLGKNEFYERCARANADYARDLGRPELHKPATPPAKPSKRRYWPGADLVRWRAAENTARPELVVREAADRRLHGEDSLFFIETWSASFDTPHGAILRLRRELHERRCSVHGFNSIVLGCDPGFGGSAACLGAFGRTRDGVWNLYWAIHARGLVSSPGDDRGVRGSNTLVGLALEEVMRVRQLGIEPVLYSGPDEPGLIKQFQQAGIDARSAQNAVLPGIRTLCDLIACDPQSPDPRYHRPRFTVSPDLQPEIWSELTGYQWALDGAGRPLRQPLKVNDHVPDMARYALHSFLQEHVVGGRASQPQTWDELT